MPPGKEHEHASKTQVPILNMVEDPRELVGDWDYSSLADNITIGKDCWLERRSSIGRFRSRLNPGLVLGERVQAFTWATFNVEPTSYLEIGDDSVLVGPIFMCAERISIGKRVVISYHVTIAYADFHPIQPEARIKDAIASSPNGDRSKRPTFLSSPILIGNDVSIGIGSLILKGVHIEDGAVIEAGSVVTRDVPAGGRVMGNPSRLVGTSQERS
jgi:acetyltransferase-like isoleucine patch superfamily enzyme